MEQCYTFKGIMQASQKDIVVHCIDPRFSYGLMAGIFHSIYNGATVNFTLTAYPLALINASSKFKGNNNNALL